MRQLVAVTLKTAAIILFLALAAGIFAVFPIQEITP